jgi:D-alanyl-D-alanine carboxypeptidase
VPLAARGRRLLGGSLVIAILIQAPLAVSTAVVAPTPAAARSVESARLSGWLRSDLDAALSRAWRASGAPGMSLAVLTGNQRRWLAAIGRGRYGAVLRPATPLRIGSVTKTFTAAIVLDLVAEGRLELDARASRYLPNAPLLRGVTIRQLLNHTSGIGDLYGPAKAHLYGAARRAIGRSQILGRVSRGRPGRSFAYSNTNYYLLGVIIERVTGRTFNQELAARFGRPLGLTHTHLVTAHQPELLPRAWSTAFFTSGAMVATPWDLARWGNALYGGRALPKRLTRAMLTFNALSDYGLGAQRIDLGRRSVPGHSGLLYDTTSLLVYLRGERTSVAIVAPAPHTDLEAALTTRYGGKPSILDVVLRAADVRRPAPPRPPPPPRPRKSDPRERPPDAPVS